MGFTRTSSCEESHGERGSELRSVEVGTVTSKVCHGGRVVETRGDGGLEPKAIYHREKKPQVSHDILGKGLQNRHMKKGINLYESSKLVAGSEI